MNSSSALLKSLLVYAVCLPLAVFLGYMLSTPLEIDSFASVGLVLFILMIPMMLRWHHVWLIASWNMSTMLFFVPGSPQLWMGLAALSLLISTLQYTLNRERGFLWVPPLSRSLILLVVVVLITARLAGGFGLRVLGSEVQGGKRYFEIVVAVAGYFALTGRRIPPERAVRYVALFFLGYATLSIGGLAGMISPKFNFLFWLFPVENLAALTNDPVLASEHLIMRSGGLHMLGWGVMSAMLAGYGLTGVCDVRRPLRLLVFWSAFVIGALGGYRSMVVQFMLLAGALFLLDGLHRTRALPVTITLALLGAALVVGAASYLPLSLQRSLAFIPGLDLDPIVKLDAKYSTDWRLQMWRDVLPEVPRYLILGKGYTFDARTVDIAHLRSLSIAGAESSELTGDYHNGPLSVIIPFGILGAFAFTWFIAAALRVLYLNYKSGDAALSRINTLLFAYFGVKCVMFVVVFGSLHTDLLEFVGLVGLSISLNGGVARRPAEAPEPVPAMNRFRLSPGLRGALRA